MTGDHHGVAPITDHACITHRYPFGQSLTKLSVLVFVEALASMGID